MIVYNVTIKVDHAIAASWLKWLKEEHIPAIIATGCFTHAGIFHLFEADDEEGVTYAVQYHTPDPGLYNKYISSFAGEMRKISAEKWKDRVIAFRTVMQTVD